MRILLIGKKKKNNNNILKILNKFFKKYDLILGENNTFFPHHKIKKKYDVIISYLSPWIIPEQILNNSNLNINFHPGPPEYPGIGCYNFAIFKKSKFYGCTAHIMKKKVDTGKIIGVKKFKISQNISVDELMQKTYFYMEKLFEEIIKKIKKKKLIYYDIKWKRKPYTKKDFNKLLSIKPHFTKEKISKIVQATICRGYSGPYVKISDYKFYFEK